MNENWIKVSEYAKLKNIALHTAYKHIKQGKIQVKKINGIKHVAVQENEKTADEIEAEQNNTWLSLQNDEKKVKLDLQLQKLKNLRQDTILKQLKQQAIKEKYRQEYCEGVLECFINSFADLKNFLIALKMEKQQLDQFNDVFKKDLKKFESALKKYLLDKDHEEQEIQPDVEQ